MYTYTNTYKGIGVQNFLSIVFPPTTFSVAVVTLISPEKGWENGIASETINSKAR